MYHLGSQQKTDGTLKLVNSNEVYLHRYRRIMRHCSNPRWVAAERKAWLPKLQPNKSPQLSWRESYREGCHEFIVKDLQPDNVDTISLRWSPAGKESIPHISFLPCSWAFHWLNQMVRAPMEAIQVCLLGQRPGWRNGEWIWRSKQKITGTNRSFILKS